MCSVIKYVIHSAGTLKTRDLEYCAMELLCTLSQHKSLAGVDRKST